MIRPIVSGAVAVLFAATVLTGCSDEDEGPGLSTDDAAAPLKLEIRPVVELLTESPTAGADGNTLVLEDPGSNGDFLELGPPALTAADVDSAEAHQSPNAGLWAVDVAFTDDGNEKFGELTGEAACAAPGTPGNRIAFVVDDEIISAPAVTVSCGQKLEDGTQISGNFSRDDAEELADRIEAGQ